MITSFTSTVHKFEQLLLQNSRHVHRLHGSAYISERQEFSLELEDKCQTMNHSTQNGHFIYIWKTATMLCRTLRGQTVCSVSRITRAHTGSLQTTWTLD
jgi:hypothetical protein